MALRRDRGPRKDLKETPAATHTELVEYFAMLLDEELDLLLNHTDYFRQGSPLELVPTAEVALLNIRAVDQFAIVRSRLPTKKLVEDTGHISGLVYLLRHRKQPVIEFRVHTVRSRAAVGDTNV
jgi:hypothetical protein